MIPNCKKEINNLLDFFYPVGIYIETSDANFNPNETWGGTWVQDTDGLSTIAANTTQDPSIEKLNNRVSIQVGEIKGELNHQLTIDELAKHYHKHRVVMQNWAQLNGKDATSPLPAGVSNDGVNLGWSNFVAGGNYANDYEGNNQPHNNVQPSIGVIRWHRIS